MAYRFNPLTGNLDLIDPNVNADWNAVSGDAQILNKPTLGSLAALSSITNTEVAANAEIAVSKLADGAARQLLQTDAAGTGVEWASNIDIPGTLDVTLAATFDSTVSVPLGSASAPSLFPGTDTNTGFWSPGADTLAVSTGGSERVRIDSSGRVGVGISNPSADLHIFRNAAQVVATIHGNSAGTWTSGVDGGGNYSLFSNNATSIVFSNSGLERARIDSFGRLLVGTSSPFIVTAGDGGRYSPGLQRVGALYADSAISSVLFNTASSGGGSLNLGRSNTTTIGSQAIAVSGDVAGTVFFSASDGVKQVTAAQISGAVDGVPGVDDMPGRLVFSTTADGAALPTERMLISSSGQIIAASLGTAAAPVLTFAGDLNTGWWSPGADTLALSTNGVERVRVSNTETRLNNDLILNDGGAFTTTLQLVTPTSNRTISFPDATGTVALVGGVPGQLIYNNNGAYSGVSTLSFDGTILTLSGRFINSYNAAASAPAKLFSGTWFTTGGTATTTKPHVLVEPAGTTSTNWSTSGTGFGINAPTGFTGNILDLQLNGARVFSISSTGALTGTASSLVSTTADGLRRATSYSTITYGATTNLDLATLDSQYRTISLTGNLTFTTSNLANGRTVVLRLVADGTTRNLTFPAGWKFIGVKPTNIAASKSAILSLTFFGSADADCIAAYGVEA